MAGYQPPYPVGGQAVMEGVMMRAQHTYAIAVKRPDGSITIKEDRLHTLAERYPFLLWPFFRGPVVLLEALVYGIKALSFSAQASLDEGEEQLSPLSIAISIMFACTMAIVFFGLLPHFLSNWVGWLWGADLTVNNFTFHVVDGIIKIAFFLLYVWSISFVDEIRRVFEYHGAEHKSIFTFEAGEALTVENARKHQIWHPRCGTSFILVVLLTSILVFTVLFPLLPVVRVGGRLTTNLVQVGIKILLMFPIASVSYEIIRLGGRYTSHPLCRLVLWPGLLTQRLTAREPSDEQLEVALEALRAVIQQEESLSRPMS
ncbi:MAG: DUF1385 domain-containing protein [Desulfobacca sp.]|uniref:DUF1385 domain-containing protein n=1 Tax=Desulfobacca sp. TaxID=2067990 RepID=UPI00404B11EC